MWIDQKGQYLSEPFQRLLQGHERSDEKNILLKKVFMTQKIIKNHFCSMHAPLASTTASCHHFC